MICLDANLRSRYFSYGATFKPGLWSVFRHSHRIIESEEGPNDGLVSVASSRWGGHSGYKGTLVGVSHLDLINWTNRLRWLVWELTGNKRKYIILSIKGSKLCTVLINLKFQCCSLLFKHCRSVDSLNRVSWVNGADIVLDMLAKEGY